MAISQKRSKRSLTGSRYKASRKKKLYELGSLPTLTKIAKKHSKTLKILGGNIKTKLLSADVANVVDAKTNTSKQVKIKSVVENPANRHFVRRNILTKGTIIDTDIGKAKVTSRPGQEGTINAVLI